MLLLVRLLQLVVVVVEEDVLDDLERIIGPFGDFCRRDARTVLEIVQNAAQTAHLLVSQLDGLVDLLVDRVKLELGCLAPLAHFVLLPERFLARRQSLRFRQLGSMHRVYHRFDLRGSQIATATAFGEVRSDLEELRGLFPLDEETFVDKLLVELLDFVFVQVVLLGPILHFSQSQQPAMLFAHDVEFH